jgi:hypothetical protein
MGKIKMPPAKMKTKKRSPARMTLAMRMMPQKL